MAQITWLPAALALGLALTNMQVDDPSPAPSEMTSLMRSKLDAAKMGFTAAWGDKGGDVEIACRWSYRWLEAERELSDKTEDRIAALQAHLTRVRDIEELTKRQFQKRHTTIDQVRASEYYVAEAELWVCQALNQGGGKCRVSRTTSAR